MEVGLEADAGVADGLLDAGLSVDGELLGQHVEDLLTRQHLEFLHVGDQLLDVVAVDLLLGVRADELSPMLEALDVLSGNADVDHLDADVGRLFRGLHRGADGLDGVLDVGDDTPGDPDGFTASISDHLELAVRIALAHDARNLGGSDVESNDDVLGGVVLVHGLGMGHLLATS